VLYGRALQGAGAIGSTVLALLADLTRPDTRSKAMAFLGLSIGCAFMLAMVMGPMVHYWFRLSGIFYLTAALSCVAIVLTLFAVPTSPKIAKQSIALKNQFTLIFSNKPLLMLNFSVLFLHLILTTMFIGLPLIFFNQYQLNDWHQALIYSSILVGSFALALPMIIVSEKKRLSRSFFIASVMAIVLIEFILSVIPDNGFYALIFLMLLFFTAFTFLEAMLPSMVSKVVPIQFKGTAMGFYSSFQFFGIFLGGALGGLLYTQENLMSLFLFCAIVGVIWLMLAYRLPNPPCCEKGEEQVV
jgi:predicted MFS family arabinose efflux permease